MAQNPSSVMHRTNPRAATNPKKEAQPTRMCRDDSNKGNQPHHTHTHTTKNKRGRNRRSNSAASTPFIVAVLLLFVVDPPLSFPGDDHCIHTNESTSQNNNNGHSVVDERVSRPHQNKPIDTPSKQERNVHTSSSNHPTPFRSPADPTTTQTLRQTLNSQV